MRSQKRLLSVHKWGPTPRSAIGSRRMVVTGRAAPIGSPARMHQSAGEGAWHPGRNGRNRLWISDGRSEWGRGNEQVGEVLNSLMQGALVILGVEDIIAALRDALLGDGALAALELQELGYGANLRNHSSLSCPNCSIACQSSALPSTAQITNSMTSGSGYSLLRSIRGSSSGAKCWIRWADMMSFSVSFLLGCRNFMSGMQFIRARPAPIRQALPTMHPTKLGLHLCGKLVAQGVEL
jgi:hypothetical protein